MRQYRFLPALLVSLGLALLMGALGTRPSGLPAPAPAPLLPAEPDALATATLDRALGALADDRLLWLEAEIWQKVQLPGFAYEADGRYRMGPGHRFRVEVKTHLGGAEGTLLTISDGTNLWQGTRVGPGPWSTVTRVGLPEVFAALNGPSGSPRLRAEFLRGPTFTGVAPLLHNLRDQLIWVRREADGTGKAERVVLTGVWPAEVAAGLAPPDRPWPDGLPRRCRLFLEACTLWPGRVEWWGPAGPQGPEALLAQLEFRDPVLNRPLSPRRCEEVFTFDPGPTRVSDRTGSVTAGLAARARQLTAPPAAR